MNKKRIIFDTFIAIFAIVIILATAKGISLSKKTSESKAKELQAGTSAPAILRFSMRNFTNQPNDRLLLTNYSQVNKQFDYYETSPGVEAGNVTHFPILFISTEGEYNNNLVYCIDISEPVPAPNNDYTPEKANAALSYLAKNGKVGKHDVLDVDSELDYYATQVSIYSVLNQINKDMTYDNLDEVYGPSMANKINTLVAGANNATFDVVFSSTGNKTLTKVAGQNYYESGLITVSATQKTPEITLSTSFSGVQILNSSDDVINGPISSGSTIKIRVPVDNLSFGDNDITINANVNAIIDQAYTYSTNGSGGIQPILLGNTYEENKTGTGQILFTANKENPAPTLYGISILKVDGDSTPLAGAELVVKKQGTNEIVKAQFTTTTNSIAVSGLLAGNYYIEEVVTPNGYIKSNNVNFSLPADDGETINVVNTLAPAQVGNVTINKVDGDGRGVLGATIQLRNADGSQIRRFTTELGHTSHTFENLEVGTYTIIEDVVPVGYRKAEDIVVNVSNGQTITRNVVNEKTSITIIKHNENNQPLAGAELEIVNSSGTVVYEWTTNNTGSHTVEGIPVGSYKVREKKAPLGYSKTDEQIDFTIQHEAETQDIIIKNYKTLVKISKIDKENNQLIAGANLVVKKANGDLVKSFVTNGTVYELSGLATGSYTVEETQAPEGYALSDEKITFDIDDNTKELNVKFSNNKLVSVPSTSASASTILLILGFLFITCGGAFIYYYVKTPQNL